MSLDSAETPRPSRRGLWMLLAVAMGLRLLAVAGVQIALEQRWERTFVVEGDAAGYWELATKITRGEEYKIYDPPRYALRMPGFPLLLTVPIAIFDDNPLAARIWLAMLGTLGCVAVYLLGRELFDHRIGLVACGIAAVSPPLVGITPLILSETSFATAMTFSLYCGARLIRTTGERSMSGWAVLTGLSIAVAVYVRPGWLPAAPLFAGLFLCFTRKMTAAWRMLGAMIVGATLMAALLPWAMRNAGVTGRTVWTTLWAGPSLYDGLNPDATGKSDMRFFELKRLPEADANDYWAERAWKFARENPGHVVELAIEKQKRFWLPWPDSPPLPLVMRLGFAVWFCGFFGLAVWGIWIARREFWALALSLGPILYFAGLHCLFVGSMRYRLPAEYPSCVLVACGLCHAFPRLLHKP